MTWRDPRRHTETSQTDNGYPAFRVGDGVWTWMAWLPLLGETQMCTTWLHDLCPHPGDCVCRCHGDRWKEFRL